MRKPADFLNNIRRSGFSLAALLFVFSAAWAFAGVFASAAVIRGASSAVLVRRMRDALLAGHHRSADEYFAAQKFLVKMSRLSEKNGVNVKPVVKASRTAVDFFSTEAEIDSANYRLWYAPEHFLDTLKSNSVALAFAWFLWLSAGAMAAHFILRKILFVPLKAVAEGREVAAGRVPRAVEALVRAVFDARGHLKLHSVHSSVLLQAAKSISSHADLNRAISGILDTVSEKFPETMSCVTMLDDDGFVRVKNARGLSAEFVKKIKLRRGEGAVGECMEMKKLVAVQDAGEKNNPLTAEALAAENIKSFIHVPIIVENRAVGTFNINSSRAGYFTRDILDVAATLAEYLSVAVTNAGIYRKLKDFNRRLESEVGYTTSELLKTNAKLVRKIRTMKSALDIFAQFGADETPAATMEKIFRKIKDTTGADFAALVASDYDCARFRPLFRSRGADSAETVFGKVEYAPSELAPVAEALAGAAPTIKNEPLRGGNVCKIFPPEFYVKSSAYFPVSAEGRPEGAVILANKMGGDFDEDDAEFMQLVAARLGVYIQCVLRCRKKPAAPKK